MKVKYTGEVEGHKKALETDLESLKEVLESNCGYKLEDCHFILTGDKKPVVQIVAKSIYKIEKDKEG